MEVIGINGSARKDGNTRIIMEKVMEPLRKRGCRTYIISLSDKTMHGCRACFACTGTRRCVLKDDFNPVFQKMTEAHGILLGSPVYSADVSSTMKAFLERAAVVVATNPGLLKYKVGASVAAVRRGGGLTAVDTMNHFMLNKEMVIAGSTYWNMVYGQNAGDVTSDSEGMNNMQNLGENMGWILERLTGDDTQPHG